MNEGPFRYQIVENHIRTMAQRGTLTVGQRLPSLRRLSAALHLSIATVNMAYQELERKGLVEARQRSGFSGVARPVTCLSRKEAVALMTVRAVCHGRN